MVKKNFIIIFLLLIPFVSAEITTNTDYNIITAITRGSQYMINTEYKVYASIVEAAGITISEDYNVCVGITCQMFITKEETTPTTTPTGGGGGGNIIPEQRNLTTEELTKLINDCVKKGGTVVNIKGGLFCKTGEEYEELKIGLITEIGKKLYPKNPKTGIIILIFFSTTIILFVYDRDEKRRQIRKAKRILRQQPDNKELQEMTRKLSTTNNRRGRIILRRMKEITEKHINT